MHCLYSGHAPVLANSCLQILFLGTAHKHLIWILEVATTQVWKESESDGHIAFPFADMMEEQKTFQYDLIFFTL